MKRVRRFLLRLLAVFGGGGRDEVAAELETHLALLADDNIRRGMSPSEARRHAAHRLGSMQAVTESLHDQRVLPASERADCN